MGQAKIALVQEIPLKNKKGIQLFIKREDLLHLHISGNKYRKLFYNLQEAKQQHKTTLLTFGGAFSNHISATAYAGQLHGFKTIGVIRGEELEEKIQDNPTLLFAQQQGMQFYFVTREVYRNTSSEEFIEELKTKFGNFYLIPEGGTNDLAVKGCEEILNADDQRFDYICSSVGTGGTISGLINASKTHQKVLGFPALKGNFLHSEITKFVNKSKNNWQLITDYHFGGYAKLSKELIAFINNFKSNYNIPLDPIYTSKLMYGIFDMIRTNKFEDNSKILAIHTGGLQGIAGMNKVLKSRDLPLIDV